MTTATARADIHSPTNLITEDYDFLGCLDWGGSGEPDPQAARARMELINRVVVQAGRKWAHVHDSNRQCDHCGAHLRYAALMLHRPTNTVLVVGETCLDNRFERASADFHNLRKQAELDRQQQRIKKARAAFAEKNPDVAWLADGEIPEVIAWSGFVCSIAQRLRSNGEISERQVAAVRSAFVKAQENAARRAAQEAAAPPAAPVIEGRILITGEILTVREPDEYATFPTWKMLVRDDRGFRVWGSVPSALWEAGLRNLKGRRVSMTATVERSQKDEAFGFYSRPTKAGLLP
jgi:hypothetical protein